MRIFVDMDGVLADFDSGYERLCGRPIAQNKWGRYEVDWEKVRATPLFFHRLPMMPDAPELLDGLGHPYTILTAVPQEIDVARNEKIYWAHSHIHPEQPVICCRARDKCKHGEPGDVLIDDYVKYADLWRDMGGIFIHHTSAKSSLQKLRELGL